MVGSNESGRAFEYTVAKEIKLLAQKHKVPVELTKNTIRLNSTQKLYFHGLEKEKQENFVVGAKKAALWIKNQGWLDNLKKLVIDRVADDEAKTDTGAIDLRLIIIGKDEHEEVLNFSIKNESDSLCHPRLPTVPEQCGIKDVKIDKKYYNGYSEAWISFMDKVKKEFPKARTYKEIKNEDPKFRETFLYRPLQLNLVKFLGEYKNNSKVAKTFFDYLVGKKEYYIIKNTKKELIIKKFFNIKRPNKFKIEYPYTKNEKEYPTSCLLLFDNGWEIKFRVHTASSRLYKANGETFATEKMDPIYVNKKSMIRIETFDK
jgi:hypothetical protein